MLNFADILSKRFDKIAAIDLNAIFVIVMSNPGMKQAIIDQNQYQMEEEGIDAKGDSLGEYAAKTVQIKTEKGQRTDHITLQDTGDFYDSMRIVIDGNEVRIFADGQKLDINLADQWPDALGLTPEGIDAVRPLFNELFMKEWHNQVNSILGL